VKQGKLMKKEIVLDEISLVCISGVNIRQSIYALWRSSREIKFECIKLITNNTLNYVPKWLTIELADKNCLSSIDDYSHFCVYELHKHIKTNYALVVQADGYVLNSNKWDDIFLNFDYVGAPWKVRSDAYIDPFGNHQRVGNGGFSLRSKKLLEVPLNKKIIWEVNTNDFYKHMNANNQAEDGIICVHNRHLYLEEGCKFAPFEIALNFSKEQNLPENLKLKTFGFHKNIPSGKLRIIEVFYKTIFNILYFFEKL
jgi:hypothetical protein